MAYNPIDYTRIPLQRMDYSGLTDFAPNMLNSYFSGKKEAEEGRQRQAKIRYQDLLTAIQEKYGEPQAEAELMKAQQGNQMNAIKLENLPERERAEIFEMMQRGRHHQHSANAPYSEGSGGTRGRNPYYGLPEIAKLQLQMHEVSEGYLPGSNREVALTPEQQDNYKAQIELQMMKKGSDVRTRDRALFAKNIEKTIDSTNVDDLTSYSGTEGQLNLKKEQILDATGGKVSEKYRRYQEALTAVELEAKEIRQFFGTSITPEMDRQLKELTNPTGWQKSPEVAKLKIKKVRDTIKKQLATYQGALTSVSPYRKEEYNPFGGNRSLSDYSLEELINMESGAE